MRTLAYAALSTASIAVAAACSASTGPDDASAQPSTTTGQALAYFYSNTTNWGSIYGVPAGGGTPVKLLSGDSTHGNIGILVTFDAQNIYYASEDTVAVDGQSFAYSLHSIPIAGGSSITLASLLDQISGIAVSSANVYFGVGTNILNDAGIPSPTPRWEIHSVPIGGGAQQVLATLDGEPGAIAIDSAFVYWTRGSVQKMPIAGGTTVTLASGPAGYLRDIAVDATGVYWIDHGTPQTDCTTPDGSLWELATGSSSPVTLASSLHSPRSLAVRGADVYWAEEGQYCNVPQTPVGSVSKRAGATGATSTLASAIFDPDNLYVGDSLLYFTKVTDESNYVLAPMVTKL